MPNVVLQDMCDRRRDLSNLSQGKNKDPYVEYADEMLQLDADIGHILNELEKQRLKKMLSVDFERVPGKTGLSITIFFPVDADFRKVRQATEKAVARKWLQGCLYAYEQKGTSHDSMGHNPHVHIFSNSVKKKSHVLRELYANYQHIIASQSSIHVELKPASWYDGCKEYLHGLKSGDKMQAVEFDEAWRDAMLLPHPKETAP